MQAEEQTAARKPDGVLTKKFGAKTFIAEIFFKHDSKDTFQDKLLKVIRSEHTE
ncbi:MAG: transposon-encoded TnpW family protein [Clostridia bacterium]|nr:transposon-encoded TnpW family protein [Clostridia bacterium]